MQPKAPLDPHFDNLPCNCWTVVVSDGYTKPDWWDFGTRREARDFSRDMRGTGYRKVKTIRKHNPQFPGGWLHKKGAAS